MNRRSFFRKAITAVGAIAAAPLLKLLPDYSAEATALKKYWDETQWGQSYYVGADFGSGDYSVLTLTKIQEQVNQLMSARCEVESVIYIHPDELKRMIADGHIKMMKPRSLGPSLMSSDIYHIGDYNYRLRPSIHRSFTFESLHKLREYQESVLNAQIELIKKESL